MTKRIKIKAHKRKDGSKVKEHTRKYPGALSKSKRLYSQSKGALASSLRRKRQGKEPITNETSIRRDIKDRAGMKSRDKIFSRKRKEYNRKIKRLVKSVSRSK